MYVPVTQVPSLVTIIVNDRERPATIGDHTIATAALQSRNGKNFRERTAPEAILRRSEFATSSILFLAAVSPRLRLVRIQLTRRATCERRMATPAETFTRLRLALRVSPRSFSYASLHKSSDSLVSISLAISPAHFLRVLLLAAPNDHCP